MTFAVPTLDVATYSSVFIDLVQDKGGNFDGVGSSDGNVMLTAVNVDSVAGAIDGEPRSHALPDVNRAEGARRPASMLPAAGGRSYVDC